MKTAGRGRGAALLALLLMDLGCLSVGIWVWSYRFRVHLSDPTTYHINTQVTFSILGPAVLALALILVALVRERRTQENGR